MDEYDIVSREGSSCSYGVSAQAAVVDRHTPPHSREVSMIIYISEAVFGLRCGLLAPLSSDYEFNGILCKSLVGSTYKRSTCQLNPSRY